MEHTINDPDLGQRIAFRSTRGSGAFAKLRWTELAVFHRHEGAEGGRCWTAVTCGCSDVEGESDRRTMLVTNDLERALQHFDNSAPARSVAEQARAWEEENAAILAKRPAATDINDDEEALAWLYGADVVGKRGFVTRIANDFGMGESTVRMALANGTPLKVPLTAVARLVEQGRLARG
jgi:hypothetical protein